MIDKYRHNRKIKDKVNSIEQLSHILDGMTSEQIKEFDKNVKRRPLFDQEKSSH